MRKRPIDTFLSSVQQDVLAAAYQDPEKWWYLTELAAYAERTPSSLQRAVGAFASGGILESKRDGGRVYFRAASTSPLFEPLRQIVNRSIGISSQLAEAIAPLEERIDAFFIYGSFANESDGPGSDVDLISVGKAGLVEVAKALRPLEKRFLREFNVSCYTRREFFTKLKGGNHFLNALRAEKKLFIVGSEDVFTGSRGERLPTTT